jgi:hypothetical protein
MMGSASTLKKNWDSSVTIVIKLRAGRPRNRARDLCLLYDFQMGSGTHQVPYRMGTRVFIYGGKEVGSGADHLPQLLQRLRVHGDIHFHSPLYLHVVVLN